MPHHSGVELWTVAALDEDGLELDQIEVSLEVGSFTTTFVQGVDEI